MLFNRGVSLKKGGTRGEGIALIVTTLIKVRRLKPTGKPTGTD